MSKTGRDENKQQESGNQLKEAIIDVGLESTSIATGVPFLAPIRKLIMKAGRWVRSRVALTCSTRIQLYERGLELLRLAQKEIIVVSTIHDEAIPFIACPSLGDQRIQNYFITLHSIAYRNLLPETKNTQVKMVRYTDLSQSAKCHEAFSLLYHGKNVEIWNSQVPVEFLTADERSVLIGFASRDDGKLLGGVRLYGKENCKAMVKWVQSHGPGTEAIRTPTELAKQRGKHDDPSCLCNLVNVCGDTSPLESRGEKFDAISSWYKLLYEGAGADRRKNCYVSLAQHIGAKYNTQSFLDIGCGPAFGAEMLTNHNVQYYGLDISQKMIDEARKAGITSAYQCDALGALMKVDPRAKEFHENSPKKFNIIACQGNTFDFFLGPVQKALALFLFDHYLNENGILLFTGFPFGKDGQKPDVQEIVTRKLPDGATIRYKLDRYGEYIKIGVLLSDEQLATELVQHPCSKQWLTEFLTSLGYEEFDMNIKWYGPNGTPQDYYLWTYRRRSRVEKK